MVIEVALGTAAIGFLKKPIEDLITSSKSGIRDYFKNWQAKSSLQDLAQKIEQVGRITTVASRQASTIDEIYYPAQLKLGKGTRLISSADDVISDRFRLALIQGTAGQGKSVFLRYLCLKELRLGEKIPFFIELRKIDKENDLFGLIKQHLLGLGFQEDLLDAAIGIMLHSGKIRLFLDGFDEIKREYALGVKEQIQNLLNKNQKLQIVLSSRPGALSQYLIDIGSLQQYEIAPLGEKDYRGFFEKIGVAPDTKERLIKAIDKSNAQIKHLLSTPLMLTLLVLTCGMQQDLPDTLPEFYDSLFNLLASMHDGTKPGYVRQKATNLSNQDLEILFGAFSFAAKEVVGRVSLNTPQFEQSFSHALKLTELKCTSEGFRTDVTETVCLMVKEGMDTTFVHKSIQEYYAASFIRRIEDDEIAAEVFSSIEQNHIYSWLNEMRFLEDFQNLAYEKHIGIPHAEKFLDNLCIKGRKHITISKAKSSSLINRLKLRVARTKISKRITGIYWFADTTNAELNRYYPDLVNALSRELLSLNKAPVLPLSTAADDSIVLIHLAKLISEDPLIQERVNSATQRLCESINTKSTRMKDRRQRKGRSLLDLMRSKREV